MHHIQDNAELAVRDMLEQTAKTRITRSSGSKRDAEGEEKQQRIVRLKAEDRMDDGTPIVLNVEINLKDRSAHFDFTGTGTEVGALCLSSSCLPASTSLSIPCSPSPSSSSFSSSLSPPYPLPSSSPFFSSVLSSTSSSPTPSSSPLRGG
eukprot:764336-Hanusia_phi.AAC.1